MHLKAVDIRCCDDEAETEKGADEEEPEAHCMPPPTRPDVPINHVLFLALRSRKPICA